MEEHPVFSPNTSAYMSALWASFKKKALYTTVIFLILMVLFDGFLAAFRGMGSPTGHVPMCSVVLILYSPRMDHSLGFLRGFPILVFLDMCLCHRRCYRYS